MLQNLQKVYGGSIEQAYKRSLEAAADLAKRRATLESLPKQEPDPNQPHNLFYKKNLFSDIHYIKTDKFIVMNDYQIEDSSSHLALCFPSTNITPNENIFDIQFDTLAKDIFKIKFDDYFLENDNLYLILNQRHLQNQKVYVPIYVEDVEIHDHFSSLV